MVAIVVMVMVMITIMVVLMLMFALHVALALVIVTMLEVTPLFLVMHVVRRVDIVIPALGYKVDRPIAGVVFAAMSRPVPFMSGRDVEVQRLGRRYAHDDSGRDYDRGAREEQFGLGQAAADGDLSVQARRVDIHRNTHVAGQRRGG